MDATVTVNQSNYRKTYKINRTEYSTTITKNKAGNYIGKVYSTTPSSHGDNKAEYNLWYNYVGEQ